MRSTPCSYLIDTCAATAILGQPELRSQWDERLMQGQVGMCPVILLEMLITARNPSDRDELLDELNYLFVPLFSADFADEAAIAIQEKVTGRGWQRSPRAVDLLCAANAGLFGLQTVSMDSDFVRISKATGLRNTRINAREMPSLDRPRFWETVTPDADDDANVA